MKSSNNTRFQPLGLLYGPGIVFGGRRLIVITDPITSTENITTIIVPERFLLHTIFIPNNQDHYNN